jgi:hypothetical protein
LLVPLVKYGESVAVKVALPDEKLELAIVNPLILSSPNIVGFNDDKRVNNELAFGTTLKLPKS